MKYGPSELQAGWLSCLHFFILPPTPVAKEKQHKTNKQKTQPNKTKQSNCLLSDGQAGLQGGQGNFSLKALLPPPGPCPEVRVRCWLGGWAQGSGQMAPAGSSEG